MLKENKENKSELVIKITHTDGNDNLDVKLSSSANLGLGMIARARFELSNLENQIYKDLENKKRSK